MSFFHHTSLEMVLAEVEFSDPFFVLLRQQKVSAIAFLQVRQTYQYTSLFVLRGSK